MRKYYEKKDRLNGVSRKCIECQAELSRYNPGEVCNLCNRREFKRLEMEILEEINESIEFAYS